MSKKMEWENLLSVERYGSSDNKNNQTSQGDRSSYERDYGRILFSSAFRRLQDKTQVFPIGRNDYVRTRLTHSLEVAHIGMSLGKLIGSCLIKKINSKHDLIKASDVGMIVSAACLAHDIGNPPFGHSGENAIEEALKDNGISYPFEGNAQGFRILTKIGDPMHRNGINLTAAVLGAFMKYPCSSDYYLNNYSKNQGKNSPMECKKFGIGKTDIAVAKFVAEKLGLIPRHDNDSDSVCWCRHPFAYLMEAADDICYRIADIEDGYFSKLLEFDDVKNLYEPFLQKSSKQKVEELIKNKDFSSCVHYMRAVSIGNSIEAVAKSFTKCEEQLLEGKLDRSLIDCSELQEPFEALYKKAKTSVYQSQAVLQVEVMGYKVLGELINFFMKWVKDPNKGCSKKIAILIKADEKIKSKEERLIYMIDYVSGMTDSFALETYRKLIGIS